MSGKLSSHWWPEETVNELWSSRFPEDSDLQTSGEKPQRKSKTRKTSIKLFCLLSFWFVDAEGNVFTGEQRTEHLNIWLCWLIVSHQRLTPNCPNFQHEVRSVPTCAGVWVQYSGHLIKHKQEQSWVSSLQTRSVRQRLHLLTLDRCCSLTAFMSSDPNGDVFTPRSSRWISGHVLFYKQRKKLRSWGQRSDQISWACSIVNSCYTTTNRLWPRLCSFALHLWTNKVYLRCFIISSSWIFTVCPVQTHYYTLNIT